MTAEQYGKVHNWFDNHTAVKRAVVFLDRWLPAVPFFCYPVLIVLLNVRLFRGTGWSLSNFLSDEMLQGAQDIVKAIIIPGLTFWGGTILRARLNRPRPYDQPGFVPLVSKETKGNSFPSRHALSAAVLAVVWLYFYPKIGCAMIGVAVVICILRVVTGVHYVKDVVCGAALGFAIGAAGMWLL